MFNKSITPYLSVYSLETYYLFRIFSLKEKHTNTNTNRLSYSVTLFNKVFPSSTFNEEVHYFICNSGDAVICNISY